MKARKFSGFASSRTTPGPSRKPPSPATLPSRSLTEASTCAGSPMASSEPGTLPPMHWRAPTIFLARAMSVSSNIQIMRPVGISGSAMTSSRSLYRYNERLEVIADPDIPTGRMIWMFDDTDMARAKKIVGARQCIGGNVPGSLLAMGEPAQVDAYVKDLLGKVAGDGGFMLGTGVVLDEAKPENFRAFIDAGRKYGAGA